MLASLNHPNIAQIYGVEQGALVMELVDGETLKSPLSIETALDYAGQIAAALEAAHEKGVVHRDLKPANVMATPDRGRSRCSTSAWRRWNTIASSDLPRAVDEAAAPVNATRAGAIMGTAAYMSPEQAQGRPVDKRADIWAFGVVLWELLTGRQLFEAETIAETLSNVKTRDHRSGSGCHMRRPSRFVISWRDVSTATHGLGSEISVKRAFGYSDV